MKLALIQMNTTIGDFSGNLRRALDFYRQATLSGADLVVFPEMTFAGYPPKDLLENKRFVSADQEAVAMFADQVHGPGEVVGGITLNPTGVGKPLRNSAMLLDQGRVEGVVHKCLLPTYDVFDEARYFEPHPTVTGPVSFRGLPIGITICEDFWNDVDLFPHRNYAYDPVEDLASRHVQLLININASPFTYEKPAFRERLCTHAASRYHLPVVMTNQVGGYDDIIFDGHCIAADARGALIARGPAFSEAMTLLDMEMASAVSATHHAFEPMVYRALVTGTHDYCRKCGFQKVVIGLSGGIDSALVACIAVDALGSDRVLGVAMPSRFSSPESLTDAQELSERLSIRLETLPIEPMYRSFLDSLERPFEGSTFGVAEENIQARIRGVLLMALSNKTGAMVLSTGNKSELAVGYSTLYGDMCGGLAVISDLFKTQVYQICRWINQQQNLIPQTIIDKAPSAELRPDQTDQDDLPPYPVLDEILALYIEDRLSPEEIDARGHDPALVRRIVKMVDRNEYKRCQAAPGLKVSGKAFGVGRRIPIVHRFNGSGPRG